MSNDTVKTKKRPATQQSKIDKLSSMLSQLSEKDLTIVESVIKSAAVPEKPKVPPISIETILATAEGQNLIALAKQIQQIEIKFPLSELISLQKQNLSVTWEMQGDFDDLMYLDFGGINFKQGLLAHMRDVIQECTDETETVSEIFSASVQEEIRKDRKTVEDAIRILEGKTYQCPLKDLQIVKMATVNISFSLEDYWYVDLAGIFEIRIDIPPKKTRSKHFDALSVLQDAIIDWAYYTNTLEKELPPKVAAQFKKTKALVKDLSIQTNKLAKNFKFAEHGKEVEELAYEILKRAAK